MQSIAIAAINHQATAYTVGPRCDALMGYQRPAGARVPDVLGRADPRVEYSGTHAITSGATKRDRERQPRPTQPKPTTW